MQQEAQPEEASGALGEAVAGFDEGSWLTLKHGKGVATDSCKASDHTCSTTFLTALRTSRLPSAAACRRHSLSPFKGGDCAERLTPRGGPDKERWLAQFGNAMLSAKSDSR